MNKPVSGSDEGRAFTIDRAYVSAQAKEAVKAFVAPLAGVYAAISDKPLKTREPSLPPR